MSRSAKCCRTFVRDDGVTATIVDFEFTAGTPESGRHGPPEDYDPGSGAEVFITRCTHAAGHRSEAIALTDAERERFETETLEDPDFDPFPARDD